MNWSELSRDVLLASSAFKLEFKEKKTYYYKLFYCHDPRYWVNWSKLQALILIKIETHILFMLLYYHSLRYCVNWSELSRDVLLHTSFTKLHYDIKPSRDGELSRFWTWIQFNPFITQLHYKSTLLLIWSLLLQTCPIEQKGMNFDHDFCYSCSFSSYLFFLGGKRKGEKNNQSRGQNPSLSSRSSCP